MLIVNRRQVTELLPMDRCIDVVAEAMAASARGAAIQPLRRVLRIPGGGGENLFGLMPGYLGQPECFGVKAVSVFPDNFGTDHLSHQAAVILFEVDRGAPVALVDGGAITAIRTAAASGVATRALAREEASTLAILGYGTQATTHLEAMRVVRPLQRVKVWGRSAERAREFAQSQGERFGIEIEVAASAREAVADADIVCTTTGAAEPILEGAWVPRGCHLNVVGSSIPSAREIDTEAVVRSKFYVDLREMTIHQGGEFIKAKEAGAIGDDHIRAEIGEVLIGEAEGRAAADEITLYKSLGVIIQDLASASFVCDEARRRGLGTEVEF